ncbi:MAG: DUF3090 family protein [Actinobacteria bacterium]|nr:DUF3090 family protein [Actinomycetota bacterium]MBV8957401.1 DUF3090 family protein [Actinomycetota bacterium]MBV9254310.1 DUF3090 family protein [Actinomycetota bacterium]MBV9666144.1 DUF3090 family protein [Actinomycetota bacterium]MBV9933591.1 DUF3090 family protein [Actinomycetota bacterium]
MSYELFDVDRLTVGAVGPPGRRVFLLQASAGGTVITLKVEKQQVAALSEYLSQVLADLPSTGDLPTDLELDEPADPEWIVGALGVTYDEASDRVLLVAEEAVAEEEEAGEVARLAATREQVAALAIRGVALVEAGRPPCPLCGFPLDPAGHVCPRTDGHRPPTP